MQALLSSLRKSYFKSIATMVPKKKIQFVVLTHILADRPELLEAISDIAPISLLIGIPYSIHEPTLANLNRSYNTVTPALEQLYDSAYLEALILSNIVRDTPLIILEIGGYFAPVIKSLQQALNGNLLGAVEDTEAGHRQYEKIADQLTCPVVSVARSNLKETEDFLVGASCLYSTEKMLRSVGLPIEGKQSLTLGFGKIGRGISHALLRHHCPVSVYDLDPVRRIGALSEGFQVPDKAYAFKNAEIIYGTTGKCSVGGDDFQLVKDGALLVSCSSKDVEFDLKFLKNNYQKFSVCEGLDGYRNNDHLFYLAANGRPINFIDGAVIGPILALVQAEILLGVRQILEYENRQGLFETARDTKQLLAEEWLRYFCDGISGRYKVSYPTYNIPSDNVAVSLLDTIGVK